MPDPTCMIVDACKIRRLCLSDLDWVVELESQLQTHPWRRAHFENCLAIGNLGLVVACVDPATAKDIQVAFAIVSLGGGEAELLNIGVDPRFQRRGIAGRLLQEIVHHIQTEADTLFLEVRMSNHRAIALYEKAGFNQVGERPGYYATTTGREDALLYAMTLL